MNLKGRHLLTLKDFTPEEIQYLIDYAAELKAKKKSGVVGDLLKGKNIVLIFEKTSTRTRCAFEVAAFDEGANVTFLTNSQMGKKESIEDTAIVLGRFYDGIEFRGFEQQTVETGGKQPNIQVVHQVPEIGRLAQRDKQKQVVAEHRKQHAVERAIKTHQVFLGGRAGLVGAEEQRHKDRTGGFNPNQQGAFTGRQLKRKPEVAHLHRAL